MKQRAVIYSYITVLMLGLLALPIAACATSGGGGGEGISLDEAVELSAAAITEKLPAGTRVAIVAFEAESENLAGYVMDELTGALVDGSLEVADRNNLEYALKELHFQASGLADEKTAAEVGKFLGVKYVITGQLINAGKGYRYRLAAVNVENAVQAVSQRRTVRNDRDFQSLLAALNKNAQSARTAKYAVTENTKPQTAGTFLDRGIMFAGRGDYDLAIEDFTEAVKLDPNYALAYYNRGNTYRYKGDYDRAIADYNQSIKLDPNNAYAYDGRGNAYGKKGEYDRAMADYNQSIKLDPNNALAYYNRGAAYYNKGDYDRAIADYTQAIKLDPNDTYAYNNRGFSYYNKGDYDRAVSDYTQAIKLDPNFKYAYNSRGNAYWYKSDFDRAIADYTQAVKLDPNNVNYKANLELAKRRGR